MGLSWPAYTNWEAPGSKKPRSFNCFCVIVKRWIRPEKSWILMDGHKWYLCGITEMWWKHQCNGTWVTTPGEEWCGLGCSARCCGNSGSQRAGNQHCHWWRVLWVWWSSDEREQDVNSAVGMSQASSHHCLFAARCNPSPPAPHCWPWVTPLVLLSPGLPSPWGCVLLGEGCSQSWSTQFSWWALVLVNSWCKGYCYLWFQWHLVP